MEPHWELQQLLTEIETQKFLSLSELAGRTLVIAKELDSDDIECQSLVYSARQIYLINVRKIASTMVLSEEWDQETLQKEGSSRVFVFTAHEQEQGRGQRNSKWESRRGNIFMTVLLAMQAEILACITMLVSVAIAEVLTEFIQARLDANGSKEKAEDLTRIKWINDVYLGRAKIAGILVRSTVQGGTFIAEIGIGVNILNHPRLQAHYKSTCLLRELLLLGLCPASFAEQDPHADLVFAQLSSEQQLQIEEIKATLINSITIRLLQKIEHFHSNVLRQQYAKWLLYKGEAVTIFDPSLQHIEKTGTFKGVDEYGFAVIEDPHTGLISKISNGRMRQ